MSYFVYVVAKFPVQGLIGFPSNFLCSITAVQDRIWLSAIGDVSDRFPKISIDGFKLIFPL